MNCPGLTMTLLLVLSVCPPRRCRFKDIDALDGQEAGSRDLEGLGKTFSPSPPSHTLTGEPRLQARAVGLTLDGSLEDHGDVVGCAGLEVHRGDGNQLPPILTQQVQLRVGIGIEAMRIKLEVDRPGGNMAPAAKKPPKKSVTLKDPRIRQRVPLLENLSPEMRNVLIGFLDALLNLERALQLCAKQAQEPSGELKGGRAI